MQGLFKKVSQKRVRERKRAAMGNRDRQRVAVYEPAVREHAKAQILERCFLRRGSPSVASIVGFRFCGHRDCGQV